ncbi:hypothetical protein B0T18DRAFT_460255 [Schizothecium vesticola]|uniref:Uncharacterized protein n=1 Tax=Schizothecium vesticola TaxID=314040 RepID=A0AA40F170_9PEZI|nr:hypothetical protein B0T18DRAFT_460255 [Schizothecium vesticola]
MSARFFNWHRDEPPTRPLTDFWLSRLLDAAIQRLMDEGALPRHAFTLADLHGTYDDLRDCEESVALGLPVDSAEATFHSRVAAECRRRCETLRADMEVVRAQREEMGRTGERGVEEARRMMAEVIQREAEERRQREVNEAEGGRRRRREEGNEEVVVERARGVESEREQGLWREAVLYRRAMTETRAAMQREIGEQEMVDEMWGEEQVDEREERAAADLMRFRMRMDELYRLADRRRAMRGQR